MNLRAHMSRLQLLLPYNPRTHGLYELGKELKLPPGQAIYDPNVFGRYDLVSQRVVPKDGADEGVLALQFDLLMADAQRHVQASPPPIETDRYSEVLALLAEGSGVCLDACTSSPEPRVRDAITRLGYEYVPIDLEGDGKVVRREDLTHLSLEDASIAAVISLDTLEHIEDYPRALAELFRVLRSGGIAVFHVPCYYIDKPRSEPIQPGVDPWDHVRYFSARELVENVVGAGFTLLRLGLQLDYGAALCVAAKA
jgi:SAM-dependent methyltransferase